MIHTGDIPAAPRMARQRLARRIPLAILGALMVTALFSALVFAGSELVFSQATSLQRRLAVLGEARLNGVQAQQDLAIAHATHGLYLATGRDDSLEAFQQSSRQALLHLGLMQGILNNEPELREQLRPLAALLQTHLDALGETVRTSRQGRTSDAPNTDPSNADTARGQRAMQELDRLDHALLDTQQRLHADAAQTLSGQRTGAAVLVALNLLFLSALAARTLKQFHEHEKQRQSLSDQTLKLEAAVRARTNELHELSTYLQKQSEREKSRLARELHDELGALLTAAKLDVAWLEGRDPGHDNPRIERLAQLSHAIDQALDIKRRVLESLRPSLLDHLGLGPALIWYVQQTCDNAGLIHELDVPEETVQIDPETGLALYRIMQEALNNTIQHAHAREVRVTLRHKDGICELRIEDDGVGIAGFEPERFSHGVAGMRHRAMAIGGQFLIRSAPGQGTCIEVKVPCAGGAGLLPTSSAEGAITAPLPAGRRRRQAQRAHALARQHRPCVTAYVANSALLDTPILVSKRLR